MGACCSILKTNGKDGVESPAAHRLLSDIQDNEMPRASIATSQFTRTSSAGSVDYHSQSMSERVERLQYRTPRDVLPISRKPSIKYLKSGDRTVNGSTPVRTPEGAFQDVQSPTDNFSRSPTGDNSTRRYLAPSSPGSSIATSETRLAAAAAARRMRRLSSQMSNLGVTTSESSIYDVVGSPRGLSLFQLSGHAVISRRRGLRIRTDTFSNSKDSTDGASMGGDVDGEAVYSPSRRDTWRSPRRLRKTFSEERLMSNISSNATSHATHHDGSEPDPAPHGPTAPQPPTTDNENITSTSQNSKDKQGNVSSPRRSSEAKNPPANLTNGYGAPSPKGARTLPDLPLSLHRDLLTEHIERENSKEMLMSDNDRMEMLKWEVEDGVKMVIRRGKRVSVSQHSAAESYVDDVELAENPDGSLAQVVFGPLQRMGRISEDDLGATLLTMEVAAQQRKPLALALRGELLSGMALSSHYSMGWVSKLNLGKVVRFFFSSTFVDTELERNLFLEDCVPFLRRVTALQGIEFQVSEMRWGINNLLSESHRTSSECMKELKRCQDSSIGMAFIGLVGDRYGYRPFPPIIEEDLHMQLRGEVAKMSDPRGGTELLDKWYVRDTNVLPVAYKLSPIHVHLPAYIDMSSEGMAARKAAEEEWWNNCFEPMQDDLRRAALSLLQQGLISNEVADQFVRSVTEEEMVAGICGADLEFVDMSNIVSQRQEQRSGLLIRNLVGIREASWDDPAKAKFVDKEIGKDELDLEAAELMSTLRARLMVSIPHERLFEFDVDWEEGGIDPVKHETHRKYLAGVCDTLCKVNLDEIAAQLMERPLVNPLESEIMHHLDLTHKKCASFAARRPVMQKVDEFLSDSYTGPSTLIIMGKSGAGKSFVMAEAVKRVTQQLALKQRIRKGRLGRGLARTTLNGTFELGADVFTRKKSMEWKDLIDVEGGMETDTPCVLVRFIGTHNQSMSAKAIMQSCCQQATSFYSSLPQDVPVDYLALKDALPHSFARATAERPLYVFLDALDQITDIDVGKPLAWLPMGGVLPQHVKLVISIGPHSLTDSVLTRVGTDATVLTIDGFEEGEREEMLDTWLMRDSRRLTDEQRLAILHASRNEASALLLSILYERSLQWTSSTSMAEIGRLPDSVREAINQLFDELEKMHTPELVRLVLGAITISKEGMSAAELEDLASSSDEVLQALFVWWAPPMARVPPLQVVRLLHDLSVYLSETAGSGLLVVYQWTHRLFKEQSLRRYVSWPEVACKIHRAMAELFSGAKSKKNLPLTVHLKNGEVKHLPGNRRLPTQEPVLVHMAGEAALYNERMLKELPHHYLGAKMYWELLHFVTDFEVLEYFCIERNRSVLASLWRCLLENLPEVSPRDEYMKMLDTMEPEVRVRKEGALCCKIGEFLGTLMARLSDAKAFMTRAVTVGEEQNDKLEIAKGLDGVSKVQYLQGNYDDAIKSLQRSLVLKMEINGTKNLEVATTMHFIADNLQKQSKLQEAIRMYTESCEIRQELQGSESIDVAISLDRMGVALKKMGDYKASITHLVQSKDIFEMRLGKDNLTVATALMNLGNVLKYVGKLDEAVEKLQESITIKRRILGSHHPDVAKSIGNLGSVFEKLGRGDVALNYYAECLEIQKKSLGSKSQDVARTLKGRAVILSAMGRLDDALSELDEALSIAEQLVGHKHMDVAALLMVIADCLYLKGIYSEALIKFQDSIAITCSIIGKDRPHVDVATGLRGTGNVLLSMGEEEKALSIFQEARTVFIASVGEKHAEVAQCEDMIANTLAKMGKFEKALEQHHAARNLRVDQESNQRAIAANLVHTANIYVKMGNFSAGLEDYKKALHIQKEVFAGESNPALAETISSMGVVYKKLGQYQLAIAEHERAGDMLVRLFGPDHLSCAVVNMNLANVYQHLGMYDKALAKHEEALATKQKFLGIRHGEVAKSMGNMALTYQKLGRHDVAMAMYERCLAIQMDKQKGRTLDVARTLRGMGSVFNSQGKHAEALKAFSDSEEITLEIVGEKHLDVAEIYYSTGMMLLRSGKRVDAKEKFLKAISITAGLVGKNHHVSASTLRGLGDVAHASADYNDALVQYKKSLAMTQMLSGVGTGSENENGETNAERSSESGGDKPRVTDNMESATTKYRIHVALLQLEQFEESYAMLKDALRVFTEVLGSDHPWTQTAAKGLGEPLP